MFCPCSIFASIFTFGVLSDIVLHFDICISLSFILYNVFRLRLPILNSSCWDHPSYGHIFEQFERVYITYELSMSDINTNTFFAWPRWGKISLKFHLANFCSVIDGNRKKWKLPVWYLWKYNEELSVNMSQYNEII